MLKSKHNKILCSRSKSGFNSGRRMSKKSQLNGRKFSWPLLFLGVLMILLFFGLSPIRFLINTIKANYTKTQTVRLYPQNVEQPIEPEDYENGWWNIDQAKLIPQVSPNGNLSDFDDSNSSFYTGGNYALNFGGFRFLEEELGVFEDVGEANAETVEKVDPEMLPTDTQQASREENEVITDIETATDAEVILMDEEQAELEKMFDELESQIDTMVASTASSSVNNKDQAEEELISVEEPVSIEGDNNPAQIVEDESMISEDVLNIETDTGETAEDISVTQDPSKEVSMRDYLDILYNNSASAELVMPSNVESLSDLGKFKSALIKLSIAINEEGYVETVSDNIKTDSSVNNNSNIENNEPGQPQMTDDINASGSAEAIASSSSANSIDSPAAASSTQESEINTIVDDNKASSTEDAPIIIEEIVEEVQEISIEEEQDIESMNDSSDEAPGDENQASVEMEAPDKLEEEAESVSFGGALLDLLSNIKSAKAQSGGVTEVKMKLWYALSASSTYEDMVWHEIDTISSRSLNNASNGGYFNIEADFLQSWNDIENLHIKLEALDTDIPYIAYIDSLWLEADYEPSDAVYEINERKQWEKALEFLSNDLDFMMNEQGKLRFKYQKKRDALISQVGEMFGLASYWEDVDIDVKLVDAKGETLNLPLSMIFEEDGEFEITLPYMPRGYKPGKYSILFSISDASGGTTETIEIKQDFSWGVLAINTNKSIYQEGDDSAYLQMAVLDDFGRTLCDAELLLEISSPSGVVTNLSTDNGRIISNPECGPDNVIDMPDYYAFYMIDELGDYELSLTATTSNGVYTINDKFSKVDNIAYDVERFGPTRIYPLANYDMSMLITANQDFSGTIYDYVPRDFQIASQTVMIKAASSSDFVNYNDYVASSSAYNYREVELGYELELSWTDIELQAEDQLMIFYEFDAPDVSPEFFLLGPLGMADWQESRQWQIASDAFVIATSTNGVHVGWTNQTGAWDDQNNNYAYRSIPRKTGGGEPANYIQSNSNTSVNLGGDINTVEIGIEGYVEDTTVTTYVTPYFNGASAGTQYPLTAAQVGLSDNDNPFYFEITNSANAPTTWTWADIANLDIRIFGGNTSNSSNRLLYIDQIYIRVDYTGNTPPDSKFLNAKQRVDDSGVVDITIEVYDQDNDDSSARLDYVAGTTCDFSTPLDPTLDETDANATSSPGDADIDNNQSFQIGTTTGWITMSGGTSTVYFDWLSDSDTAGQEGDFCLQLTAKDGDNIDQSPATTSLIIDNKAPSQPGTFTGASSTKDSVKLWFGSISSDLHFNEYRIYYATTSVIDTSDDLHASTTDANLTSLTFNGAASTTVLGLDEDTTYYFSLFAFDDYGHYSSSTAFSYKTNAAPTSAFTTASPAAQRTDGSGIVDISVDVFDRDFDDSIARIDYVQGADCDFSTPGDPSLDETPVNISSSYGVVSVENDNTYQIGNAGGYILTPATNTVAFDWDTTLDFSDVDDTYCLRVLANDLTDDENVAATTTLTIDTLDPSAPGNLTLDAKSTSTVKLNFGAESIETNFAYYKIYYKKGSSGVSTSDTEHIDTDLNAQDYNLTGSTTIGGLDSNTEYVFNIWAFDQFGNASSAQELSIKTDATVANVSLSFSNPAASNWAIADGSTIYTFEAVVTEGNGWTVLDNVVFSLADNTDDVSPYTDLEFTWSQTSDSFSETGTDSASAVTLDQSSNSSCDGNTCTLQFNLIFDNTFDSSSIDYAAHLYSTNDSAIYDEDEYADFYQVKIIRVEQVHYRWRNDDGGE